jgi:hypothetical protein
MDHDEVHQSLIDAGLPGGAVKGVVSLGTGKDIVSDDSVVL